MQILQKTFFDILKSTAGVSILYFKKKDCSLWICMTIVNYIKSQSRIDIHFHLFQYLFINSVKQRLIFV